MLIKFNYCDWFCCWGGTELEVALLGLKNEDCCCEVVANNGLFYYYGGARNMDEVYCWAEV